VSGTAASWSLPQHRNRIHQQQQQQRRSMAHWPKVRPKRIRMISFDVTGTIVSFRGTLEEHYLGAAAKYGVTDVDAKEFAKSFNRAYKETSFLQPCFGGQDISAKQWWKECVCKSFQYAGADMDEKTAELVFQRIYSTFGSINAYEIFPDALPFLHWARRHGTRHTRKSKLIY
jgi:FMN phosphatase YigB (HAD superfamily)